MAVKKRNSDRRRKEQRILSAAAEVCETRALLSAAPVDLPIDGLSDPQDTGHEVGSDDVSDDASGMEQDVPELEICTMFPQADAELIDFIGFDESDEVVDGGELLEEENIEDWSLICTMSPFFSEEDSSTEIEVADSEFDFVETDDLESIRWWSYRTLTSEMNDGVPLDDFLLAEDVELEEEMAEDWDSESFCHTMEIVTETDEFGNPIEGVDPFLIDPFIAPTDLEAGTVVLAEGEDPSLIDPYAELPDCELLTDDPELVFALGEWIDDVTMLEDYDPSWAYRGEVIYGEEIFIEDLGEEDLGENEEWLEKEDFVVDTEPGDADISDDGSVEASFDPELVDDDTGLSIRFLGGPQYRGSTDGEEFPAEILMSMSGTGVFEATSTAMGPTTETLQAARSEIVPEAFGPFLTNPPVTTTAAVSSAVAIPQLRSQASLLLEVRQDELNVGTLVSSAEETVTFTSDLTEDAVTSPLGSGLSVLVPTGEAELSGDLQLLTPLLESDAEEDDSMEELMPDDSTSETDEPISAGTSVPEAEFETVATESATKVSDQAVAVLPRPYSVRAIDFFMTEFSLNGFVG